MFKDTSVPSMVVPGAPGVKDVPASIIAVGTALMGWPAMVVMNGYETSEGDSSPNPSNISPLEPALSLVSGIVFDPTTN